MENSRTPAVIIGPKGKPIEVDAHDFEDKELGKVVPYGVYDVGANIGYVSLGIGHDTAQFAVNAARLWLDRMGRERYPATRKVMVTADCGGSNGPRLRLWKVELQRLADETGLTFQVCHYPPGTSKWNKIEHRMFCHITQNWRATPLTSRLAVVEPIANTTTKTGLTIRCELDTNTYPKGIKVSEEQMATPKSQGRRIPSRLELLHLSQRSDCGVLISGRCLIVMGILAGGEHAAQRMTLIDGPCHQEHICTRQRAVAAAARSRTRFGRESLGPWNISVSGQARRRGECQELQASGGFGVEIDDFALEILGRCRPCCWCIGKGCDGRWIRNRVEAEIFLNPLAIDFHVPLRQTVRLRPFAETVRLRPFAAAFFNELLPERRLDRLKLRPSWILIEVCVLFQKENLVSCSRRSDQLACQADDLRLVTAHGGARGDLRGYSAAISPMWSIPASGDAS